MAYYRFRKQDDVRFEETVYLIEANAFVYSALRDRYHEVLNWEEDLSSIMHAVGEYEGEDRTHQTVVGCRWALIEGARVMFYYPTSATVNWNWVNEWVLEACGHPVVDQSRAGNWTAWSPARGGPDQFDSVVDNIRGNRTGKKHAELVKHVSTLEASALEELEAKVDVIVRALARHNIEVWHNIEAERFDHFRVTFEMNGEGVEAFRTLIGRAA